MAYQARTKTVLVSDGLAFQVDKVVIVPITVHAQKALSQFSHFFVHVRQELGGQLLHDSLVVNSVLFVEGGGEDYKVVVDFLGYRHIRVFFQVKCHLGEFVVIL